MAKMVESIRLVAKTSHLELEVKSVWPGLFVDGEDVAVMIGEISVIGVLGDARGGRF